MISDEALPQIIGVATRAIVENANRLGLTWRMRIATVVNGADPDAVEATYDGDTDSITMFSTSNGPIVNGSRVYVLTVPPSGNYIVGASRTLGEDSITLTAGPADNTSSTTLSGIASTGFFYTKYGYGRTRIDMSGTFVSSVATRGAGFGAAFNGTDHLITGVWANVPTNVHITFSGHAILPDAPPGIYTVTGLWKASSAGAGITRDTNDFFSMVAKELPD